MWESVCLPEADDPRGREALVEQYAAEKMRAYDGTAFLYVSRRDEERRRTFCRASASAGLVVRDALAVCPGRSAFFVEPAMEALLADYLDACPAGQRHVLFYTRRLGNGPCLRRSLFMGFWQERGADIFDFGCF